jgi:hypothetical protein
MNTIFPTMAILSAGALMYVLAKAREKPVLLVVLAACIGLAFVTLLIIHKGDVIAQRGNSASPLNYRDVPQSISKEDHHFLDDLFQQQEDNQAQTNSVAILGQNVAKSDGDSKQVPRAELIVNTSEVKRAQLVVNSRMVERAELVRLRHP